MAGSRPGAGPSHETLIAAARLGLDWLEVDVCVTRDEVLVLRHHHRLPGGRPVSALPLAELRRVEPDIVTLSEAFDCLAGRVGLMIDVKSPGVVIALVAWLARRRGAGTFSVCSESPDALRHMRDHVAWVPRWRSITALWRWSPETIPLLLRPLVRDLFPGAMWGAADALVDVGGAGATQWPAIAGTEQVAERVRRALAATGRDRLPSRIGELAGEVGAAGLSVDHWAITARLCEAAHDLDLLIAAWTVNRIELARDLARCGVDLITSDDVATMRRAVALLGRPDPRPGDQAVAISCRPPQTPPRGLPPDRAHDGRSPRQMTP